MTLKTRHDGTQYPDDEADAAVLREENTTDVQTDCGYAYHRTLANLVIDMLAGGPLAESDDDHPEHWQTLENAMLRNAALEVRALGAALEYERGAGDLSDEFTMNEIKKMARSLSRRIEAGAELAQRLRRARWGHPAFGGGEGWEAKQKQAESSEAAE